MTFLLSAALWLIASSAAARTLERSPNNLAWKIWLQPDSQVGKEPPRRITTKSLFVAPNYCPPGHKIDRDNMCVKVITVNEDKSKNYQLQILSDKYGLSNDTNVDVTYDYEDQTTAEESGGPLQLSIPIGLDEINFERPIESDNRNPDIRRPDIREPNLEAELSLLKIETPEFDKDKFNEKYLPYFSYIDKPKRQSVDDTDTTIPTTTDYSTTDSTIYWSTTETQPTTESTTFSDYTTTPNTETTTNENIPTESTFIKSRPLMVHKEQIKPELHGDTLNSAIKLISRYAEVTTDETFTENLKRRYGIPLMGTRMKPNFYNQYIVRNRVYGNPLKFDETVRGYPEYHRRYAESSRNYRYGEPRRHLQDYWPSLRRHRHARRRAER